MCNAWNHSPDCTCGWGGDGHFGGSGSYGGGGYSTPRSTRDGLVFEFPFITYPSYVNPNARCPVCDASVYFYQSPYGGRVFFGQLLTCPLVLCPFVPLSLCPFVPYVP